MKQPNNWSCLATAYAIVTNQPLDLVLDLLGHNGEQIVEPTIPEPGCRKGFHIHEIIDIAVRDGFTLTPIDKDPRRITDPKKYLEGFDASLPLYPEPQKRFDYYLVTHPLGIITGATARFPHAVAWRAPNIIDPLDGLTKPLWQSGLVEIDCYWFLSKLSS